MARTRDATPDEQKYKRRKDSKEYAHFVKVDRWANEAMNEVIIQTENSDEVQKCIRLFDSEVLGPRPRVSVAARDKPVTVQLTALQAAAIRHIVLDVQEWDHITPINANPATPHLLNLASNTGRKIEFQTPANDKRKRELRTE